MPLQFINPALQGAKAISNLKTLLFGGGPVGAVMLGASQAPRFIEAGRQNPTGSSKLSILGSMGSNLSGSTTPRPPMPGLPAGYKDQELAQGAAAEAFRTGAGFPGQQVAADRAYEAEKSRVAQLTAQDPELQRYELARKTAVAPGATPEQVQSAEDIGMAIWARSNPTLAAKVKPGQSGYDVIQGTLAGQAAAQGYGYQMPQQIMMTPPPGVNSPQGLPAVQSVTPTATYGAQGLEVDPEMAKKFQALLNLKKG